MGTFIDTITTKTTADAWCAGGVKRKASRPSTPDGLYDDCTHGSAFLQYLNITNPTKCAALFRQSLGELAASLSVGDDKTRLNAQAAQTANLAADITWVGATPTTECRSLVKMSAQYLNGGNSVVAFAAFRCFARAYGEVNGLGVLDAETALATLWKARCTKAEYANGLT
jgi:hypothetical protein